MHPDLGLNFRELAENYLAGELKKEMMPPEIRELEELREFKRKQEEQAQQAEQQKMTQAQQAEFAKLQQRAAQEYDTKISEVLRQADLPKSPETVKHVAMVLRDALQKGYDLDIATAVDMVRENQVNSLRSFTSSLKGESLVKFLGDDIVKELRQHDLARIKAKLEQQQIDPPQAANPGPATQEKEPQFLKPDDWKEYIRRKAGV